MGCLKIDIWRSDDWKRPWRFVLAQGLSMLVLLLILLLTAYFLRPRTLDRLYHVTVCFHNLTEQDGDLLLTAYDYENPFIIEDYAKRVTDLEGLKERAYFRVPLEIYTITDPEQIKDDREMWGADLLCAGIRRQHLSAAEKYKRTIGGLAERDALECGGYMHALGAVYDWLHLYLPAD